MAYDSDELATDSLVSVPQLAWCVKATLLNIAQLSIFAWRRDGKATIVVDAVMVEESIDVPEEHIPKLSFASMGKEGSLWTVEDMPAKDLVELPWHLAVVPCVIVKFGAAWRGGAVVDCSGNCRGGEGSGAKDALIEEVVTVSDNKQ